MKGTIGLALVFGAPLVHSFDHEDSSQRSNIGHSRNAQAVVSNANINNYCGKDYQDAYETCPLACPTGDDNDCLVLGEEYSCQVYTLCHERIKNGEVVPNTSGGDNTPTPSPHESTHIAFPSCPPDYSLGSADYSLGSLVAFPIIGALKEVYECQGDFCNALPGPGSENGHLSWSKIGSCTDSTFTTVEPTPSVQPPLEPDTTVAPTAPAGGSSGATWYLRNDGVNTACVYGADYPEQYITNESLRERFIFESEMACCAKYPIVCGGTDPTTTTPAPSSQPTASPVAGSSDPTSEPTLTPTYQDSEIATDSACNMGHGIAFGVAMICVALLF